MSERQASAPVFDRRLLRILVPVLAGGLLITLFFIIFGTESEGVESAGTDVFSRSALGHHALVAFLESTGTPVLVSRQGSAAKARVDVPLLILEPPRVGTFERLQLMIQTLHRRDRPAVVVLPKWQGEAQEGHAGWIEQATLLPKRGAARVLDALFEALGQEAPDAASPSDASSSVATTGSDAAEDEDPEEGHPVLSALLRRPASASAWNTNSENHSLLPTAIGAVPDLLRPQLAADGLLDPVLACAQGTLAGWLPDSRILVITDPDLINTVGLARGDNAVIAHALLVDLLGARAFVVDEVLHGFGVSASVSRTLLRFPFICLSLHALLLAALLLWRALGGFGRPIPPPSRLPPGKGTLIDNTADLLAIGERGRASLVRYLESLLRRAARQAQVPVEGDPRRQADALHRLARARGVRHDIRALTERATASHVDRGTVLSLAHDIHAWFEEMFHDAHRASRRR
jgi:hypothetical protein